MNCGQCGAPMKVEAGQDVFHCEYCGAYDFSDPNQDGVALLDRPSAYPCPACGLTLMEARVGSVPLFSCPNCRGNLIEQAKIHPILRQSKLPPLLEDDIPDPRRALELNRKVACPSCGAVMEAYPYGGAEDIFIQGCARCGLVWLDFGELAGIQRSYKRIEKRYQADEAERKKWGTL